jgi:hypothetical protein
MNSDKRGLSSFCYADMEQCSDGCDQTIAGEAFLQLMQGNGAVKIAVFSCVILAHMFLILLD